MTIGDADMSPMDAHRLELHQAMRRQHEADLEQQRLSYEEQRELESPEAEEARWMALLAAQAKDTASDRVTYRETRLGIDHRVMGP